MAPSLSLLHLNGIPNGPKYSDLLRRFALMPREVVFTRIDVGFIVSAEHEAVNE